MISRRGVMLSIAVFALLSVGVRLTAQAVPTFSTQQVRIGGAPNSMVTADFNRDGRADMAVAAGNSVWVLLGNGDGTFRSTEYAAGTGATHLQTADFNADGIADLVVANSNGDLVILFGNGDGTFKPPFGYKVMSNGNAPDFAAADFNGDGRADLAFSYDNKNVTVLIGVGDGTFTAPQTVYTANWGAYSFAVGDFNGDGRPDILFADCCDPNTYYSGGYATVLFNQGGLKFTPNTQVGSADFYNLEPFNFHRDGVSDFSLSYAGCHTPCDGMKVALGSRSGTVTEIVDQLIATDLQSLPGYAQGGDFNGDGRDDIAYSMGSNGGDYSAPVAPHQSALILLGQADGSVATAPVDINVGGPQNLIPAMLTGDFNGDGRPDLALAQPDSSAIAILLNTTAGTGGGGGDFAVSVSPGSATVTHGAPATFTVAVAPKSGFSGTVSLSCTGLPAGGTCTFNPAALTVSSGQVNAALTITTAGATSAALGKRGSWIGFAFLLPAFGIIVAGRRRWLGPAILLLVLVAFTGLVACGSGSKSSSSSAPGGTGTPTAPVPPPAGGTPAGTYTVSVVATSGNVQHSATVTLTVQ